MKHHRWQYSVWGVTPGSGRPYGEDETWVCRRCGATKSRGPRNTSTGARVIRWTYTDSTGCRADSPGQCTGGEK